VLALGFLVSRSFSTLGKGEMRSVFELSRALSVHSYPTHF
jgi:hypothetical protein